MALFGAKMQDATKNGFRILAGASIGAMIGSSFAGAESASPDVVYRVLVIIALACYLISNLIADSYNGEGGFQGWQRRASPVLVALALIAILVVGKFSYEDKLFVGLVYVVLLLWSLLPDNSAREK